MRLFDDVAMSDFVARGFVSFEPELPADFHDFIHRQTRSAFASGNPGNNILPLIPELQTIFEEPRVRGALTSILGHDYAMHPHRHCHVNSSGSEGQRLHKDAFSVRFHRTQDALVFYYPHDVTEEMGPSAVVPGSHYHGKQLDEEMSGEETLCGKAGTVVVAHYDLWHRATANRSSADRYMIKFLFTRMSQPRAPSWNSKGEALPTDDSAWWPLHSTIWDWNAGRSPTPQVDTDDEIQPLVERLGHASESVRLQAAYRLGRRGGEAALAALADKLLSADEEVRHAAGYALSAIGPAAVETTMTALDQPRSADRSIAIEVLGNIGETAAVAVPSLARILSTGSPAERSGAAVSLGKMNGSDPLALPALIEALRTDEEENVKGCAALALARLAPVAPEATAALEGALLDTSWYVRGTALEGLERIGTTQARGALLTHLRASRWCSLAARA